jgi:flagellar basal-body rod protein FlgG
VLYGSDFTNLKAGPMRQTANPLDFAIEGNGFFEVLTPGGIRLTRAGNLSLDTEGRLVTRDGFLILGPSPAGIQTEASSDPAQLQAQAQARAIRVGTQKIQVDIEGNIYRIQDGVQQNLGRLSVVQVENPASLKPVGGNLFEAGPDAFLKAQEATREPAGLATTEANAERVTLIKVNPLGPTHVPAKIHQGMLEASNVNPVQQMTRLIEAHRLYDQNLKVMQSVGDMNSKISEVGKF